MPQDKDVIDFEVELEDEKSRKNKKNSEPPSSDQNDSSIVMRSDNNDESDDNLSLRGSTPVGERPNYKVSNRGRILKKASSFISSIFFKRNRADTTKDKRKIRTLIFVILSIVVIAFIAALAYIVILRYPYLKGLFGGQSNDFSFDNLPSDPISRSQALMSRFPLIDTHNDLPLQLRLQANVSSLPPSLPLHL